MEMEGTKRESWNHQLGKLLMTVLMMSQTRYKIFI